MVTHFKSVIDLVKAFPTETSCLEYLELFRWNGVVVSPFDESSKVYKCTNNRYKCKNSGKYFNVKTGTIFEDTKIPMIKWFMALYIFSSHKKGISSHQLAKDIDVTQKTAWFILHRLRYAFDNLCQDKTLANEVEADETFIGGKEKNKHASKRSEGTQGRSTKTKKPVFGMKEREGDVIAIVVPDTKSVTLQPIIETTVVEGSTIYTDEWIGYTRVNKKYIHQWIDHSAKQYVDGMAHTNGMENFWSQMKRGIDGIYHWCSYKHLQGYVNEFALRYNTRKYKTDQRFNLILQNTNGRLKYHNLIAA